VRHFTWTAGEALQVINHCIHRKIGVEKRDSPGRADTASHFASVCPGVFGDDQYSGRNRLTHNHVRFFLSKGKEHYEGVLKSEADGEDVDPRRANGDQGGIGKVLPPDVLDDIFKLLSAVISTQVGWCRLKPVLNPHDLLVSALSSKPLVLIIILPLHPGHVLDGHAPATSGGGSHQSARLRAPACEREVRMQRQMGAPLLQGTRMETQVLLRQSKEMPRRLAQAGGEVQVDTCSNPC
jgi:hypothetical protein